MRRPSLASIEELPVREANRSIDDRFAVAIEAASSPHELEWAQGRFDG
jgi:hypothetical protein